MARNSVCLVEKISPTTFTANWKGIIIVGLLTTIVSAGCLTGSHPKSNEPSYQGVSLSEWLRDFDNQSPPERQAMAAEAIRHIGSQAVPFLVARLSEARLKHFNLEMKEWQDKQESAVYSVARPANPRQEALAALDALGSMSADALPALEKLLHDDPPDLHALYVAARIGPAGVPLLTKSLTNEVKAVRLSAQVCLDMMRSHSEVLYPKIPVGSVAPSFDRRTCEFNLKVMQAAALEYGKEHPELNFPTNFNALPPTSLPVPVQ
jgi:hypothetical protein